MINCVDSNHLYVWFQKKRCEIRSYWLRSWFRSCDETVRFGRIGAIRSPWDISIGKNTVFNDYFYLTAWEKYTMMCQDSSCDITLTNTQRYENKVQSFTPSIVIGDDCSFGAFNHITCINSIRIGNGVLTGKWVTITDNSHGLTDVDSLKIRPRLRPLFSKGPVVIQDNVWIGEKVTILGGVTIGKGAVIAANSVVTKNIPDFSVAAGIPAKVIR